MHRPSLNPFRSARGPASACAGFLAGGLALAALLGTGCEGTSSGVDNPGLAGLTVSFSGAEGVPVRVTGDLDVYGKDQNPALDPEPLATVRIKNSAVTSLTAEDFQRINTAGKSSAATKRSAAGPQAAPVDTPMAFNLVFRSDERTGSLTFGLRYDPRSKAFTRDGSGLARLDIEPRQLVHYEARLLRQAAIHGDVGRVFIPGTPFQAPLSDSGFAFEALPPGVFDLRLVGGDGRIFAVRESLDTRATTIIFTPDSVPVGRIDTTDSLNKPVHFTVNAGSPPGAYVGTVVLLGAKLDGVDTADKRLGFLWRVLRDLSPDTAGIQYAHSLHTQAQFNKAGVYAVELAVTLGAVVVRDTVHVSVVEIPAPAKPRVLIPRQGDTLLVNVPHKLAWESSYNGPVSVQLSVLGGRDDWQVLADKVPSVPGTSYFVWTPPDSLSGSFSCLIRIMRYPPDSLVAQMEGNFFILPQ